jgi:L-ascorbate metabolism protein UlaG (beta-lactamase superfamily)
MHLTWFSSNTWLIEMAGLRILLDPWLVGDLTFGNLDWLFKGSCVDRPLPDRLDLILLSQGLEDHAHPETLKLLDRSIPVIASPSAAKVVTNLGYTQITTLNHGQSYRYADQLTITATTGSLVGPTAIENGYVLRDLVNQTSLYYEPHGSHDPALKQFAPVDVVITPIADLKLPLGIPIIRGDTALSVVEWLQPKILLPSAAPGDVSYEGLLVDFLTTQGSAAQLQQQLMEKALGTKIMEPKPGDRLELLTHHAN